MAEQSAQALPSDLDAGLAEPQQRSGLRRAPWAVLGVVSLGGGSGGLTRYALGEWFPTAPGSFPWTTFGVNATGCLLIGMLMVLVNEVWSGRRLVRPFLGVGVLGGYTTFSFHVVEVQHLFREGAVLLATASLAGTAVVALAAVAAGLAAARWLIRRTRRVPAGQVSP